MFIGLCTVRITWTLLFYWVEKWIKTPCVEIMKKGMGACMKKCICISQCQRRITEDEQRGTGRGLKWFKEV